MKLSPDADIEASLVSFVWLFAKLFAGFDIIINGIVEGLLEFPDGVVPSNVTRSSMPSTLPKNTSSEALKCTEARYSLYCNNSFIL